MERILYFLGAGFSAPLGLPICSTFIHKARDLFRDRPGEFAHFKEVLTQVDELARIKHYYISDQLNIEEVFSILDMRAQLRGETTSESLRKFITDVINFCTPRLQPEVEGLANPHTAWPAYFFGTPKTSQSRALLFSANLLGLTVAAHPRGTPGHRDWYRLQKPPRQIQYGIVTVNYDRVLEMLEDHLRPFVMTGDRGAFVFATGPEAIWTHCPLVKLHGDVKMGNIVPPTWNKSLHPEMVTTWQRAEKLIGEATQIRFLGYSFPTNDVYLQYLLKVAALRNTDLKQLDAVCLDPDGTVRARFESVIGFRDRRFQSGRVEDYWALLASRIPTSGAWVDNHQYAELEAAHEQFFERGGSNPQ